MNRSENVNILFVSNNTSNINEIHERLGRTMGFPCNVRVARDIDAAADVFRLGAADIELLLLDVEMIDTKNIRHTLETINMFSDNLPLIIFTERKDHELALLAVRAGAADNVTHGEMGSDPFKLRDAIEFALARHRIRLKSDRKNLDDMTDMASENAAVLGRIEDTGRQNLQTARAEAAVAIAELKKSAQLLVEKEHTISWLGGGYSVENIVSVHKK